MTSPKTPIAGASNAPRSGSGLCPNCNKNEDTEAHACPYQSEINDNDDENYCACCKDCEHECAMDI